MRFIYWASVGTIIAFSCDKPANQSTPADSIRKTNGHGLVALAPGLKNQYVNINTGKTTPAALLDFACSLKNISYKYGSADPKQGFDCSGFVTYVFNHFGIIVPRPSVDYTFVNKNVAIGNAKPGDLILFTGTDSTVRIVGHIGIIVSNQPGGLIFIHATSGNGYGVTETPFNLYYRQRFMKIIRVFPQNDH